MIMTVTQCKLLPPAALSVHRRILLQLLSWIFSSTCWLIWSFLLTGVTEKRTVPSAKDRARQLWRPNGSTSRTSRSNLLWPEGGASITSTRGTCIFFALQSWVSLGSEHQPSNKSLVNNGSSSRTPQGKSDDSRTQTCSFGGHGQEPLRL